MPKTGSIKETQVRQASSSGRDLPCLQVLFREQAAKTPDAVALVGEGGEMTYAELDEASDGLAASLAESGVGRDAAVGVYMERSPEYVVAMLAALKAGGAFLPLELAYPGEMLREVVENAGVGVTLTKARYVGNLPDGTDAVFLDDGWQGAMSPSASPPDPDIQPDDLAFIAYSSGTTGKPKGIANPHRAAVGSYLWRFGVDAPEAGDRVGCNVFFIWEVLRPLLRGAATVVIPDDVIYSPEDLVSFLRRHAVTETLFTPSLLETVLNRRGDALSEDLPALKTLWLNGEVVTKGLVARAASALPRTRLLNVYSISEAHELAAGDLRELADLPGSTYCAVGLPADPEAVRVLDDEMEPVPSGEAGELYVGGDLLARGYVGLPEKTAERFPENPFADVPGPRIYRTGDRARFLPGGELEILGRAGFMVKVRGYSIELGAVETAIESSLPVTGCCVVADGDEGEDKRLVAYVVPEKDEKLPPVSPASGRSPEMREALKDALPHYAIPSAYVEVGSLPLQKTTGKVDRDELPPPPGRSSTGTADAVSLPEDPSPEETAGAVRAVFELVLGLEAGDFGMDEDFFAAGGHSLAAAEVLGHVEDVFGVRLPVGVLLENPTPAGLAGEIEKHRDGKTTTADGSDGRAEARRDAELEGDVSPARPARRVRVSEARGIFLTGATGFLGTYLLRKLLENTGATVRCLVRGDGGLAPVRESLRRHGLWRPEYASRLEPVSGDLGSPLLGLRREGFDALAGSVEVVVHAGAAVNLVYPYASLRAANVEGTREVLRLCATGRPKTLHHVSTNGVFPPGHGFCAEDADPEPLLDGLKDDGYGQSKWAAEKLVLAARDRGLPAFVYRPGNISGSTKTGLYNRKDLLSAAITAALALGLAPEPNDGSDREPWRVEMSPVDFVARSVFRIADHEEAPEGSVFHLADPNPPTAGEFFDLLERAGYPTRRLPLAEWLDAVSRSEAVPDLAGAVIGDGSALAHVLDTRNAFDDTAAQAASSVERPELDAGLLKRYAQRFKDGGSR